MKYFGIGDKLLNDWLKDKDYITTSDEAEAVAMASGHYLATGERASAFMSADGFMNALNFVTSWVIPEGIELNIIISIGRQEPPHKVASDITEPIIELLKKYDTAKIHYEFIRKQ